MTTAYKSIAFVASPTPEAQAALHAFSRRYANVPPEEADVVVALGGDGLMLQTLHRFLGTPKPIYGMNRGSVGFLMNDFQAEDLPARLAEAQRSVVHPLLMVAHDLAGETHRAHAINEVSMLRQTHQAAKLSVSVDGQERLSELIADGVLIATPAGSTAYNFSVGGPILPLSASLLALTPISAFRPRRWRGALLPDYARVAIQVSEPSLRPVSAVADHTEFRKVTRVEICMDRTVDLFLLHDPGHSLDERILREQFGN
ncbi:NAD kinase [Salinarimonas soli]|uniref:NAD kinase n=1 Tax=Salinarimonas soli TaxID=1638099 RepID=A0A5B2VAI6_9HYPH|nr:NAD kinase [Salinarimonas soli]KAA2235615.1 NAD kinase [Salinarimonas soli]